MMAMKPEVKRYRNRLLFSTILSSICIAIIINIPLGLFWLFAVALIGGIYMQKHAEDAEFAKRVLKMEEEKFNMKAFNWFASITTMLVFGIFTYINLARRENYPVGYMTSIMSVLFMLGLFWVIHTVSMSK